jgi:hypothetical protein
LKAARKSIAFSLVAHGALYEAFSSPLESQAHKTTLSSPHTLDLSLCRDRLLIFGSLPLIFRADSDTYSAIHSTGFREFLLKPELLRAIGDCGFEHPSEGTLSMM